MSPARTLCRLAVPLLLLVCSTAAEARRFRFFGIPSFRRETIEQVYDLPDRAPYFRDGEYYDLGYLHGFGKQGFVLYRGDAYVELDDSELALLKIDLGLDPVAGWKGGSGAAPVDARQQEREAQGLGISRKAGESTAEWEARKGAFIAAARRSSAARTANTTAPSNADTSGTASVGFGILMFVLFLFGGWLLHSKLRGVRRTTEGTSAPVDPVDDAGFEQRLARRLAELEGEAQAPVASAPYATAAVAPAYAPPVRGFGRKAA